MQMVKKVTLVVLGIWLALLLFMPKSELYHTIEKSLEKRDIKLNEKSIEEGLFSLKVKEVTVYIKGIPLATIEEFNFFTLLFYSSLAIENLIIDEALHDKVPALTQQARIRHQLFMPLTPTLDANGSFGEIIGSIDLIDKIVYIDFIEAKNISMLQPFLTKGEKGWKYEKSF